MLMTEEDVEGDAAVLVDFSTGSSCEGAAAEGSSALFIGLNLPFDFGLSATGMVFCLVLILLVFDVGLSLPGIAATFLFGAGTVAFAFAFDAGLSLPGTLTSSFDTGVARVGSGACNASFVLVAFFFFREMFELLITAAAASDLAGDLTVDIPFFADKSAVVVSSSSPLSTVLADGEGIDLTEEEPDLGELLLSHSSGGCVLFDSSALLSWSSISHLLFPL